MRYLCHPTRSRTRGQRTATSTDAGPVSRSGCPLVQPLTAVVSQLVGVAAEQGANLRLDALRGGGVKPERVLMSLARRLDHDAPGVSVSIRGTGRNAHRDPHRACLISCGAPLAAPMRSRVRWPCCGRSAATSNVGRRTHGAARGWDRNVGGRQKLPPLERPQATPILGPRCCTINKRCWITGSTGFNRWRLLHQFQQAPGLSEGHNDFHYSHYR